MRIDIQKAKDLLSHDGVIAIPTETVYGLAASLASEKAIKNIFTLKSRPADNPLIVHVSSMDQVLSLTKELPPYFHELINRFWPGALTLVVPAKETVPKVITANLPTVGIRMPNHPLTLELIRMVGPLVAPSANLSGRPSSTSAKHVEHDFGSGFPVLDDGKCKLGMESTILIYLNDRWQIGRLGSIAIGEIETVLPYKLISNSRDTPLCPGIKHKHYSPNAKLILSTHPYNGQPPVVLGFKDRSYRDANRVFILGDLDCPESLMSNFYETLRLLDTEGIKEVWVDTNFPQTGLFSTLRERLEKAAVSP